MSAKQGSKWGSFLSGAVANLESRLDKVFEEEGNPAKPSPKPRTESPSPAVGLGITDNGGLSRTASPARSDSQKQKQTRQAGLIPTDISHSSVRASSESRSTAMTGATSDLTSRTSLDSTVPGPTQHRQLLGEDGDGSLDSKSDADTRGEDPSRPSEPVSRTSFSAASGASNRPSTDIDVRSTIVDDTEPRSIESCTTNGTNVEPTPSVEELQVRIAQMQVDYDVEAVQKQQDEQSYLERIDALQAKLQYLAKEAVDSARERASDVSADSLQKKLAAKDEQIALLMEEGQKLSKAEVTHAGNARRLRLKSAEDSKALAELRQKIATGDRNAATLTDRIRRLEVSQREANTKSAKISQLDKELQNLRASHEEKDATVQYLRAQLDDDSKRADGAKARASEVALEQLQRSHQSLQDDLANAKIETQLSEDRLRGEITKAREEVLREQDNKKTSEAQMRNEISILESRLETLRARTEEASSGFGNDSQAKLMRQIETLQTQYSLASENWQGIEGSLQARLTAMEKERDDTARAESDARRRAREASGNSRRLQEQLELATRNASVFEQELSERQAHANHVEERAHELQKELKEANSNFERERQQWQTSLASRLEEEKAKWRQEMNAYSGAEPPIASIVESPTGSSRRPHGFDIPGLSGLAKRGMPARQFSTELSLPSVAERPRTRRSATKLQRGFEATSPGVESGRSTPFLNGGTIDAPSIHTQEPDDIFDNDSSPHRTVNDMISVSTANAGPSVQLVERMSAAVRRLESEKAATKDELIRLAAQRDEARKEVVSLMSEIEEKRSLDIQVKKLQQDMVQVEARYQTTLEMLGEKTERAEELEADVADLKKIYRELAQTMPDKPR